MSEKKTNQNFPISRRLPTVERLAERPEILRKLAFSIKKAQDSTFFYKRLLRKHFRNGISEKNLLDNFSNLPFTSKEDVVRNYPNGFLAVPMSDVALYCESTGTTGNTLTSTKSASFYTDHDLESDCARRFSPDLALQPSDIVANALPFALTSSGVGFYLAARNVGATVVNLDGGSVLSSPIKHLDIARDLDATVLVCSLPTLYSTLLSIQGQKPSDCLQSLRAIQLCGLATLPNAQRKIENLFRVPVYNTYGLSEFGAVTFTCSKGEMHVHEGDFFIEIIDPRTGGEVSDRMGGEIVITTLGREGSPKIRYRTADFGLLNYEECSCGRDAPRLTVKGRLRDAALFLDQLWLPIDFEEFILAHPATTGLYRLVYEPAKDMGDTIAAIAAKVIIDVEKPGEDLRVELEQHLREQIGPNIEVKLTSPGGATPFLFAENLYESVRTVKAATFEDGRPAEWLVTY